MPVQNKLLHAKIRICANVTSCTELCLCDTDGECKNNEDYKAKNDKGDDDVNDQVYKQHQNNKGDEEYKQ